MILIIYSHPNKTISHNGKILKNVIDTLDSQNKEYEVLDLYEMSFDAYFRDIEYKRMRNRERDIEEDVKVMQEKVTNADTLIFIYPTWWYNMPARLKGFMDRVFTAGFAYKFTKLNKIMLLGGWMVSWIPGIRYLMQPYAVKALLRGKKALIFRTYGGSKFGRRFFGSTQKVMEEVILRFCGITNIKIHELFNTDKSVYTKEYENRYMDGVRRICESA